MFETIRDALIIRFQTIGQLRRVLLDFEAAAHQAVSATFPGVKTQGCLFHFSQAIVRRMHSEGLHHLMEKRLGNSPARNWLGRLKSLALLPVSLVRLAFNVLLQPPNVPNQRDNAKLRRIADYFQRTFLVSN
jgi:hypothetical protein